MIIIYIIVLSMTLAFGAKDCPSACKCLSSSSTVECTGQSFAHVLKLIPRNTSIIKYNAMERYIRLEWANFSGFSTLKELHIAPYLDTQETEFFIEGNGTRAFNYLDNLSILKINMEWIFTKQMPDIFSPLSSLEELDLSYTSNVDYKMLALSFSAFASNCQLQVLRLRNIQNIVNIVDNGFFNLSILLKPLKSCPLKTLDLSYNAFQSLYPGTNQYARNLTYIDLSYNLFGGPMVFGSMCMDLLLHPSLEEVDLSNQGYRPKDSKTYFHVTNMLDRHRTSKCNNIMVSQTTTENFQQILPFIEDLMCIWSLTSNLCNIFTSKCESTLQKLKEDHELFCRLLNAVPLGKTLFEGIPCDTVPPITSLIDRNCGGCFVFPVMRNVKRFHVQNLNFYLPSRLANIYVNSTICFNNESSVKYIDVSDNGVKSYPDMAETLELNITGFRSLEVINASNIGLTKMVPNLNTNVPKLTEIDFSLNKLTLTSTEDRNGFRHGKQLKVVNLAYNKISITSSSIFSPLENLEVLNLSHNVISSYSMVNVSSVNLKVLDLSSNLLKRFDTVTMNTLNTIGAKQSGSTLTIDLSDNNLLCTCEETDFLQWMKFTKAKNILFYNEKNYFCNNENYEKQRVTTVKLGTLRWQCFINKYYIVLIVSVTTFSCILFFLILGLLYKKRWWFRYHYYLARKLFKNSGKPPREQYQYDVFVSYNEKDEHWVNDILQPKLEDNNHLRLCLHWRDFELGGNIVEQIIHSIENSHKTLLILSPNFLASTWCQYEMQMAQTKLFSSGEDVLLLALLRPLPKVGVSKTLKTLMETKTYIEWTEEDEYGQKLFWGKLLDAVKTSREEPFDVEDYQADPETRPLIQE